MFIVNDDTFWIAEGNGLPLSSPLMEGEQEALLIPAAGLVGK